MKCQTGALLKQTQSQRADRILLDTLSSQKEEEEEEEEEEEVVVVVEEEESYKMSLRSRTGSRSLTSTWKKKRFQWFLPLCPSLRDRERGTKREKPC